jgi:hypothetical protein
VLLSDSTVPRASSRVLGGEATVQGRQRVTINTGTVCIFQNWSLPSSSSGQHHSIYLIFSVAAQRPRACRELLPRAHAL